MSMNAKMMPPSIIAVYCLVVDILMINIPIKRSLVKAQVPPVFKLKLMLPPLPS